MRLDVAGDGILERVAVAMGLVPSPLVQVSFGMGYARGIVAGVRLGVFEAIAPGEAIDAGELARRTGCHPVGIETLANALVGFGALERRGGLYSLGTPGRRWLRRGATMDLVDAVDFLGYCLDLTANLEADVRTGEITRLHDRELSPGFWRAYMKALANFVRLQAPEAALKIRLAGALPPPGGRVLDVGGGHGAWAAQICRRVEGASADVLDLAPACAVGRELVAALEGGDRVSHVEGDFREGGWGQGYDLVMIFHVLHNATEEESRGLLASALAALKPGGWLAVLDAAHPGKPGGDLDASAGYNELFFFVISGARAWPERAIAGWIEDAGFEPPRVSHLMAAPEALLLARRPA